MGSGHAPLHHGLKLTEEIFHRKRHAVADNIHNILPEHTGRKLVQGKLSIVVYNGVPRVGAALKTHDNIGILRQHVRDLPFAFIAPTRANYSFYHDYLQASLL